MKVLNNQQATGWLWELLDEVIVRSAEGSAMMPIDLSAVEFVRGVGRLVVEVQDESPTEKMLPAHRAQREAKVWSEYRSRAQELKRLFCSTSENAFHPYEEPFPVPYFVVPWYFSLLYKTSASLRRQSRRYAYGTFNWRIDQILTEHRMDKFAAGFYESDRGRTQRDWNRLCDLLATAIAYGLFWYAFDRLVSDTKERVLAEKSEEEIIIGARESWADFWILSLPPAILQLAHNTGTRLNFVEPEALLGSLAGWLGKNMAHEANRQLLNTARRENDHPSGAVFQDTMAEMALQIEALQAEALDGYYLRSQAASSLKNLYREYLRELSFAESHDGAPHNAVVDPADERLLHNERNMDADRFVRQHLAPRELAVYSLYELPDREIADRLGIAIGTVASQKNRIRKKLRQHAGDIL